MKFPLTKDKYFIIVGSTIFLLIFFFAYMDVQGLLMVNSIGGYASETYAKMHESYMTVFWTFAYVMIIAVSLMFYVFRRDISESVAIFVGSILMLWGGLEDIIYYWMLGQPGLDASMPWLWNTPLSLVSRILGFDTVTPAGLYLQLILFTWITIRVVKWLRKQNRTILGVSI